MDASLSVLSASSGFGGCSSKNRATAPMNTHAVALCRFTVSQNVFVLKLESRTALPPRMSMPFTTRVPPTWNSGVLAR